MNNPVPEEWTARKTIFIWETSNMENYAGQLRTAIENLINVKLYDAIARRDGLDRLVAHRSTGVASPMIRDAEAQLQAVIAAIIPTPKPALSRVRLR